MRRIFLVAVTAWTDVLQPIGMKYFGDRFRPMGLRARGAIWATAFALSGTAMNVAFSSPSGDGPRDESGGKSIASSRVRRPKRHASYAARTVETRPLTTRIRKSIG